MSTLVHSRFLEWTSGLSPLDSRVSIFTHIRDIPYSLTVPIKDPASSPDQILSFGRGYCGPKHFLLASMFRKLGLDVVYATFPFLWNDPDLRYPPNLRTLAAMMPVAYHLACRVRINGRWILVDATWDPLLVNGGFPVNEYWDGLSDTRCAVKPLASAVRTAYCRTLTNEPCRDRAQAVLTPLDGENDHRNAEDHIRFYQQRTGMRTPEQIAQIARFYPEFDAWLEKIRQSG